MVILSSKLACAPHEYLIRWGAHLHFSSKFLNGYAKGLLLICPKSGAIFLKISWYYHHKWPWFSINDLKNPQNKSLKTGSKMKINRLLSKLEWPKNISIYLFKAFFAQSSKIYGHFLKNITTLSSQTTLILYKWS